VRIVIFVVLGLFVFEQFAFFIGFIGPVPDSYLDLLIEFNGYIEFNYAISVLLAEFIFPIIILNLLGKKIEFNHFKKISSILAQISAGLILFIILLAPIEFYLYVSMIQSTELQIYHITTIILTILLDLISLLIFLFCIYKLRS
jgi:hypothetical protein